jgi:hypothetical protein
LAIRADSPGVSFTVDLWIWRISFVVSWRYEYRDCAIATDPRPRVRQMTLNAGR